jgi:Fe-S-cluster containining protein
MLSQLAAEPRAGSARQHPTFGLYVHEGLERCGVDVRRPADERAARREKEGSRTVGRSRNLDAGSFALWLAGMNAALHGTRAADVPCHGCSACCTSFQFVHIGPDETDALAHIPARLLAPALRRPRGHVVLGYDERGRCPMLIGDGCSIYDHRPRTCRTYDCRVFAATGLAVDKDRPELARQSRRWRFQFPTEADWVEQEAVRAAAACIRAHADRLPLGSASRNTTRLAVLAVEIHGTFLRPDEDTGRRTVIDPALQLVRAAVRASLTRSPGPRGTPKPA